MTHQSYVGYVAVYYVGYVAVYYTHQSYVGYVVVYYTHQSYVGYVVVYYRLTSSYVGYVVDLHHSWWLVEGVAVALVTSLEDLHATPVKTVIK